MGFSSGSIGGPGAAAQATYAQPPGPGEAYDIGSGMPLGNVSEERRTAFRDTVLHKATDLQIENQGMSREEAISRSLAHLATHPEEIGLPTSQEGEAMGEAPDSENGQLRAALSMSLLYIAPEALMGDFNSDVVNRLTAYMEGLMVPLNQP